MNEPKVIHVVEDDADLRRLLRLAGEKRGYVVRLAADGSEAKRQIEGGAIPDVIILDIAMPAMDGFSFCRWLRDDHPLIPVIFLSARTEEVDRVLALEIGGDDYLSKPFSMKELFTRIAVSLRRVELYRGWSPPRGEETIDSGLSMNVDTWTCSYRGQALTLTVSEFRILRELHGNPGMVLRRERLSRVAFPEDHYNSGRGIDVHISRIRRKLEQVDPAFSSIETVYQVGYKWKS